LDGSSATFAFALAYAGTGSSGALTFSLSGTAATDFRVRSTTCGASLAPKTTCSVTVAFVPQAGVSGTRSAILTAATKSGARATASLAGTAGTSWVPVSVTVVNGTCSGGSCATQCESIPISFSGTTSLYIDAAGPSTSTASTFSLGNVVAGSPVTLKYVAPVGTRCTCSTDPNNVHAQCADWGCSVTLYSSSAVSSAVDSLIYCVSPIL
jgi:hypothetical protein